MKKRYKKIKNYLNIKKNLILIIVPLIVIVIIIGGIFVYHIFENKGGEIESGSLSGYYSRISSMIDNELLKTSEQEQSFIAAPKTFIDYKYEPEMVKAIYLSSWSASRKEKIEEAIEMAKNTEINAVVVDIKESTGFVAYDTNIAEVDKYQTERILIPDIKAFLEKFHKEKIYVIARIAVFQDSALAKARPDLAIRKKLNKSFLWLDNLGLAWIDPSAKDAWDYNAAIARDALDKGFDEVNFDYVRFPSDGNLQNMSFPLWDGTTPKNLIMGEFFKYLRSRLPGATLSIDFFGYSTINFDDLNIGQIIEDVFEYFDYVCPMVYPSHYRLGFLGYESPAQHPYEVVKYSMDNALKRLIIFDKAGKNKAKLRPWLQDFDLLGIAYDANMVKAQIQAVSDALGNNFCGFMLWNSRNIYTRGALQSE